MINTRDILETITMIQEENLDIRTITMGISLLDCCDSDIQKACGRIYEKITRRRSALCARVRRSSGSSASRSSTSVFLSPRLR